MYKKLEEFISDNRNAFDSDKPSGKVWSNIQDQLKEDKKQNLFINRSLIIKAISVAAAIIIVVWGALYFVHSNTNKTVVAKTNFKDSSLLKKDSQQMRELETDTHIITEKQKKENNKNKDDENLNKNEFTQELYYYTRLAEIKYNQLKRVEKDEPLLYKSFAAEVKKLDSTYHSLQTLLATNPDKEAVLDAMINTLKMQVQILNKQLEIIHTINQAKKEKYENNYQTL
ncbi:MAG TPA: hypothetical protein VN958_16665 [Chitinophagaceae bacterium]|nr:hypothetical protein [Chitinophagaceae bacterium]